MSPGTDAGNRTVNAALRRRAERQATAMARWKATLGVFAAIAAGMALAAEKDCYVINAKGDRIRGMTITVSNPATLPDRSRSSCSARR